MSETLIATRKRRANAGSRLRSLINAEEIATYNDEDENVDLLFQEGDSDDGEFSEGEEEEENNDTEPEEETTLKRSSEEAGYNSDEMFSDSSEGSSSSDDENEGERELQKHEKHKKRKQQQQQQRKIAPAIRKASQPTATKTKRKVKADSLLSESRRLSTRRSAVQNKIELVNKLKESEKRQSLMKPKVHKEVHVLTQEERLVQAVKTEKQNRESLNRFQEQEIIKKQKRSQMMNKRKVLEDVIRFDSQICYISAKEEAMDLMVQRERERKKERRGRKSEKQRRLEKQKEEEELNRLVGTVTGPPINGGPDKTGEPFKGMGEPFKGQGEPVKGPEEVEKTGEVVKVPGEVEKTGETGEVTAESPKTAEPGEIHNGPDKVEEEKPVEVQPVKSEEGSKELDEGSKNVEPATDAKNETEASAANKTEASAANEDQTAEQTEQPEQVKAEGETAESSEDEKDPYMYEGPAAKVVRNYIMFENFNRARTDIKSIRKMLFGVEPVLPGQRKNQKLQRIVHILSSDNVTSYKSEVFKSYFELQKEGFQELKKFPRLGEYDKNKNLDDDNDKDKNLNEEIVIETPAPSSIYLANGNKKICFINGKTAIYFEPKSGIPYSSSDAYKIIDKIKQGEYAWCDFGNGGAYIGHRYQTRNAKGVPEGF